MSRSMNSKLDNSQRDKRYDETNLESRYGCKSHRAIVNQAVEELHAIVLAQLSGANRFVDEAKGDA